MLNQVLESIAEKAEAFPVVSIVQCSIYNSFGEKVFSIPDEYLLQKQHEIEPKESYYVGRASACFTKTEAEFISEARGDILMLVDEVKRLRKLVEQCQEGFEAVRRANHARGHEIADEMLNVIEEVKEWL